MDVSCTFGSTAFDLEGDFIQSLDRDYDDAAGGGDDVVARFWDTTKEKYGINRFMDWAEGTQPLPGPIENTAFSKGEVNYTMPSVTVRATLPITAAGGVNALNDEVLAALFAKVTSG